MSNVVLVCVQYMYLKQMRKPLHIFIFFIEKQPFLPETFVFQSTLHGNQTLGVTRIILSVIHCMLFCAIEQAFLIEATYR